MKCRVRCQILFGLVALLQFVYVNGKGPEKDHALILQTKVENLIEKILKVIEDYYNQIRTELKCIPDEIPDIVMGTLKNAIDCVDQNERSYDAGRITANVHKKGFLKCFSDAKTEVEDTITSINPNLDYCPENMTEKTYQINVTTTFTKTFHINIRNGLEIMKKKVHLGNEEQICVFNQGEGVSGKPNQTTQQNEPSNDFSDEDVSGEDENIVKDLYSKGHHGKGHEFNGRPHKENESKNYYSLGQGKENLLGIGDNPASAHGGNDSSNADNNAYQPLGHQVDDDNGHASKEHHGKGYVSKERPDNDHKPKEHHGKGPESKEILTQGHESKERPDNDHKPKEHHGKGPESKEILTQGHESEEEYGKGHDSKVRPNEEHQSKERPAQGHVSKEHLGKGHEPKEHHGSKENLPGMSDSGEEYEGNDPSNENDVSSDPNDNGESDSDLDNPLKELPGYGGASNDDDDDDYDENEFSNADENDEESDFSGSDEDKNGGVNRPDSAQDNDQESETEGHHTAHPDSQGFHGKGHESKETYDKSPDSAQQPEDYEGSYEDDDVDDADGDADDDEDVNFLQEGKQNINGIADHAAQDIEIKNKTKDKSPFTGYGPITDDVGNDDIGTDDEKFFFPDATAKFKLTTLPANKLDMESPTGKPFEQDYYADPDTEPEDSNYGNEYYDASEKEKNFADNPDKSLHQKLAQLKSAATVAPRIQIKPKNRFKHKPNKPSQNSERHKITLPKNVARKSQPFYPSPSITSLSQSFSQSDF